MALARACLLTLMLGFVPILGAEAQSLMHRDTFRVDAIPPYSLRPFVRPDSVEVFVEGVRVPAHLFRIQWTLGLLTLDARIPQPVTELVVVYRTWPAGLALVYGGNPIPRRPEVEVPPPNPEIPPPTAEPSLRRQGSITRGVLVGSNRDALLESGLRLAVEGEVSPGVMLRASLTDANTPLVPDGTTRRLSDFDRVFIEVRSARSLTQLGDFDVRFDQSEFAQLQRTVQGGAFRYDLPGQGIVPALRVSVLGTAPRGQTRVQVLNVRDGIQGPYRLEGALGEPFITVIPGSEIVTLDGQRLERDREADYTIDYATGEVTFTPRRLVTAGQRIVVTFQYRSEAYPRTLAGAEVDARWGRRLQVGTTVIRQADAQSLTFATELSRDDSLALTAPGVGPARVSGAERVSFDPEAPFVHYRKEVVGVDTIFVALAQAPNPGETVYRVRFTRVPEGTGRYVRSTRAVSGIVYEFVGQGGAYEPIRFLPRPQMLTVVGLRSRMELLDGVVLRGEWARALFEPNRFAPAQTTGDALRGQIDVQRPTRGNGTWSASANVRVQEAEFQSFERTRPVSFATDWGLGTTLEAEFLREERYEGKMAWEAEPLALGVEGGMLSLGTTDAKRILAQYRIGAAAERQSTARWQWNSTQGPTRTSASRRGEALMQYRIGRVLPRVRVLEDVREETLNTVQLGETDLSGGFREVAAGLSLPGTALGLETGLVFRTEYARDGEDLAPSARSVTGTVSATLDGPLRGESTLGVRRREQTSGAGEPTAWSVVAESNLRWRDRRQVVDWTFAYDAETQRAPRLQEVYVRVSPELAEALFIWVDENGNGIPEIDEFFPERTPFEGTYARLFVPADQFASVAQVGIRSRITLDASRLSAAKWADTQLRLSVDVQEKSERPDFWRLYVGDLRAFLDPRFTQNGRIRRSADLDLLRRNPKWLLTLSHSDLRQRNRWVSDTERRAQQVYRVAGEYRPAATQFWRLDARYETLDANSDRFGSRTYKITGPTAEAAWGWSGGAGWSTSFGMAGHWREEAIEGASVRMVTLPLEVRYGRGAAFSARAFGEWAQVWGAEAERGAAAFELTNGRGSGRSLLWGVSAQVFPRPDLQVQFQYDGRAADGIPRVHTLRMSVTALF